MIVERCICCDNPGQPSSSNYELTVQSIEMLSTLTKSYASILERYRMLQRKRSAQFTLRSAVCALSFIFLRSTLRILVVRFGARSAHSERTCPPLAVIHLGYSRMTSIRGADRYSKVGGGSLGGLPISQPWIGVSLCFPSILRP